MTVDDKVLEAIRPTPEEQASIDDAVRDLKEAIGALVDEKGLDAEPILVGSVAKGTHLKAPDLDLFIRFSPRTSMEIIRKEVLEIGRKVLDKPEKRYAQHPYIKGRYEGFDAEIVPCYNVPKAGAKMSAVDRTPFHARFIIDNMGPELRDQVRLFKAFLKGIGIYGAEIAVEGFSGYLCEIVVLKYGGFRPALEGIAGWRRRVQLRLDEGEFPHFDEPLVFIDPVDPARNVGAPVSEHSFSLLVHAARAYLRAPAERFFFPGPVEVLGKDDIVGAFATRETGVVGIVISLPDVVEDIYASQVSKAERAVAHMLETSGFPMIKSHSFMVERPTSERKGQALLVMETGVRVLSAVHTHTGPEVGHPNEADFLEKWKDDPRGAGRPHVKHKRWVVYVHRDFRRPDDLLMARMEGLSIGKHLTQEVKEGFRLLDVDGLAGEFPGQMSEFIDDRFPWER